jgi:transketolase
MSTAPGITVKVRLFASLRRFQPKDADGPIALRLPTGAVVKDAVAALGIPPDRAGIVVCQDQRLDLAAPLADGVEVSLFPPLAGGGSAAPAEEVARLKPITRRLREHVIRMITAAGSGHPGGSLSAAEILTVLFFHTLRRRSGDPAWPERDRFVISKGHGVPILYAALAEAGELPVAELQTLRKLGSRLQGHPDRIMLPWVEAATGSLGQGLSLALGMALASRLDGGRTRVFCLLGDGELQAGQVWEAAMAAGKYRVSNLVAILDYNKVQLDGPVPEIMDLEPLADKWRSFNWRVRVVADGNDLAQVLDALDESVVQSEHGGAPQLIIAHTVKGKGVSFMEGKAAWHGKAPTPEEAERCLKEIADHG